MFCEECHQKGGEQCPSCNRAVDGHCVRACGSAFHPDCFVCVVCKKKMINLPFVADDKQQVQCLIISCYWITVWSFRLYTTFCWHQIESCIFVRSGAATCFEDFVICFLKDPLACFGSIAASVQAVQPNGLGSYQKTFYKNLMYILWWHFCFAVNKM